MIGGLSDAQASPQGIAEIKGNAGMPDPADMVAFKALVGCLGAELEGWVSVGLLCSSELDEVGSPPDAYVETEKARNVAIFAAFSPALFMSVRLGEYYVEWPKGSMPNGFGMRIRSTASPYDSEFVAIRKASPLRVSVETGNCKCADPTCFSNCPG